jgi:amidase
MTTHHLRPEQYHTTIGAHQPVLRIADGDTVVTTTVDARGHDQSGDRVTEPGNPQTGPFYVEGADRGDALLVTFDRLRPNRQTGWSRTVIAENVLDPSFVRDLPTDAVLFWEIDVASGTARPCRPPQGVGEGTIDPPQVLEGLLLPLRRGARRSPPPPPGLTAGTWTIEASWRV